MRKTDKDNDNDILLIGQKVIDDYDPIQLRRARGRLYYHKKMGNKIRVRQEKENIKELKENRNGRFAIEVRGRDKFYFNLEWLKKQKSPDLIFQRAVDRRTISLIERSIKDKRYKNAEGLIKLLEKSTLDDLYEKVEEYRMILLKKFSGYADYMAKLGSDGKGDKYDPIFFFEGGKLNIDYI